MNMRLSAFEINAIKRTAKKVWGDQTTIRLFGSRTDDSKKGGDIDLLVLLAKEQSSKNRMLQKAEFLALLEFLLGEQKIDILIKTRENADLPIIKTAEKKGIVL